MVSMIRTLNKISKDYRYVVRVLAQEKRELKVRLLLIYFPKFLSVLSDSIFLK